MSFTMQLLKGCVMLDIIKVVNRYLVPKNPTFKQMCNLGIVEHLLVFCQNNNPDFNNGLNSACQGGQLEIVNLMIKKGAFFLNDELENACEGGHLEIVNLIISRKIEIGNLMIEKGVNTWKWVFDSARQIFTLMNNKGAIDWNRGLYSACHGGHFGSANPFCAKGTKRALLEANARSTRLEIVNLLIKEGADDWNNGLWNACSSGNLEIVTLMIEKGATYCGNCNNHNFS
jgi:ankyrin repeat protein